MKLVWLLTIKLYLVSVSCKTLYERIGYFWHITDIHYDGHFNSYLDTRKGGYRSNHDGNPSMRAQRKPSGPYGDYSWDSTWELIESAAKMMMTRQSDNVEFVLWTGDALSHHATHHINPDRQMEMVQNVTDLLRKTFSSQFVFPALGHNDPTNREALGKMWSQWLPTDAMDKFKTGGYYIIERKTLRLQIIVLNTNLMKHSEEKNEESKEQWRWLEQELSKLRDAKKTAYIVGHIPPGSDERHKGSSVPNHIMYKDHQNKRYLSIIRKYHSIIMGQFFGHLHSDTFRIVYSDKPLPRPISWVLLSPSITPKRTHDGPNNPGLRIYKFDKDTGKVFDYTQYYLDLSATNNGKADWVVEYNFSTYYGINEITASNLHSLTDKFKQETPNDKSVFIKYYLANSANLHNRATVNCDDTCSRTHYCAITQIDYTEYDDCLKIAASEFTSSSNTLQANIAINLILVGLIIKLINILI